MALANVTLRQLHYLRALAATGHFRRAAEQVGVSQPSLSAQIALLEERLSTKLIERGGSTAILTPRGRDVAERARRILADVQALEDSTQDDALGLSGTVRLGVSPTLGPYLMPHVVARLHRDHPQLKLHVREGSPDELMRHLASGVHDTVLIQLPIVGNDFIVERLFREALLLVMAADDPLAASDTIDCSDLAGRGLLTLSPRYQLTEQIAALAHQVGAEVLRDYEGTSLDAIRQMAGMGMGLALLPSLYLRAEVRNEHDVVVRPIKGRHLYRELGLVWRRGAGRASAYQDLAAILTSVERTVTGDR